jgi:type IV pilus assembly protein PilV
MTTPASCNNKGFTLLEVLVAVVILTVGLLGLMQTVNYALNHNLTAQLRQEATLVADQVMSMEKARPYDDITAPDFDEDIVDFNALPTEVTNSTVNRLVNGANRMFTIVQTVRSPTPQSKNIEITVSWIHKQTTYTHSLSSIVTTSETAQ